MIAFTTLGPVALSRGEREATSVLAQPKRLSLLAYLAVAAPGGYVRRDTILATFWPESEPEQGRGALRQATRFLRRALGSDAIVSRGADALGVASPPLWCDAVEFGRRLDVGEPERALALYRGPFLSGVHVSEVPEFDRWLESVRAHLAGAAVEAAWQAVDRAERDGRFADARSWAAWATSRAPSDELGIRRRLTLLDTLGDRATAIEVFDRFAAHVEAEYGLDPAPETVALVRAIRTRTPRPAGAAPSAAARTASAETATTDVAGSGQPGFDPRRVLVAVFENRTNVGRHDSVGSLAADWIAHGLMQAGVFDVVPLTWSMTSTRRARAIAGGGASEDAVRVMAEDTRAGTVVTGAYYEVGDRLQFHVRIVDATAGTFLHAPQPIEAPAERPLDAIAELSEWVVTVLAPRHHARARLLQASTPPPSFAAYQAYVEGLERFMAGHWAAALEDFERCETIDPSYALPRIVAGITRWNLGRLTEAEATVREIERGELHLGTFELEVLRTLRAWLQGDWRAAHEAATRQSQRAPGSIAHYQVAEEARRLNRLHEARDVLAALDPVRGELRGFPIYWSEACQVHHLLGEHDEELRAARRARELYPNVPLPVLLEARALAACGRLGDLQRLMDHAAATPGSGEPTWGRLAREVGLVLRAHGHRDAARQWFDRSLEWFLANGTSGRSPASQRRDHALAHAYCGHVERAYELFVALLGDADDGVDRGHHGHLHPHLDLGFVGVLALQRGDPDEAASVARRLAASSERFHFGRHSYWLAVLAVAEGDSARGVTLLRRAFSEGLPHQIAIHVDPHLERLRGERTFAELMRPTP